MSPHSRDGFVKVPVWVQGGAGRQPWEVADSFKWGQEREACDGDREAVVLEAKGKQKGSFIGTKGGKKKNKEDEDTEGCSW